MFAKFQAPKFENQSPKKCNSIPPSCSIPPLDTLLVKGEVTCAEVPYQGRRPLAHTEGPKNAQY